MFPIWFPYGNLLALKSRPSLQVRLRHAAILLGIRFTWEGMPNDIGILKKIMTVTIILWLYFGILDDYIYIYIEQYEQT